MFYCLLYNKFITIYSDKKNQKVSLKNPFKHADIIKIFALIFIKIIKKLKNEIIIMWF